MCARKLAPWAETVCSVEETKVVEKALVAGGGRESALFAVGRGWKSFAEGEKGWRDRGRGQLRE
jgi:hypothetical protein